MTSVSAFPGLAHLRTAQPQITAVQRLGLDSVCVSKCHCLYLSVFCNEITWWLSRVSQGWNSTKDTWGCVYRLMQHTVAMGSEVVAIWKAKVFSSAAPAPWKGEGRQKGETGKQVD